MELAQVDFKCIYKSRVTLPIIFGSDVSSY
jgi:hypothetical protein